MAKVSALRTESVRDQVSDEEWAVRVDLAALYRLVTHFGWDDLIFTHHSARVPGSDDHFLINPFGLMLNEITASSLLKVDVDGNVVMESEYPYLDAGFAIHSAVHMAASGWLPHGVNHHWVAQAGPAAIARPMQTAARLPARRYASDTHTAQTPAAVHTATNLIAR